MRKSNSISPKKRKDQILTLILILLFAVAFVGTIYWVNRPEEGAVPKAAAIRVFVPARVVEVVSDDASPDTWTEGRRIGSQYLRLELLSGEFKGEILPATNFLNVYHNIDATVGTRVIVRLEVDEAGEVSIISIPNYDRGIVLLGFVLMFVLLLVIIGGKKGVMALLGLVFTLICIWSILIPLIRKGAHPIGATILIVAATTVVSLLLLTGLTRKTLCAVLGCLGGVTIAGLAAYIVGRITPINGFNMGEAEELVLRGVDGGMTISGLLVCGILISSLGAVMDVAMSIASSCFEIKELNPDLTAAQLFRSGMNVGRDAMGTMANTLILAFAGSSLNLLILFQVFEYPYIQVFNSDLMTIEVIQGVAGSMGIILTVPLVAFICSWLYSRPQRVK